MKQFMNIFETKVGVGFPFKIIDETMRKKGFIHNRSTIRVYLKYLIDHGKIVNVRTKNRGKKDCFYSFYGIPSTRKDCSRYLIINKNIQKEIVEINTAG